MASASSVSSSRSPKAPIRDEKTSRMPARSPCRIKGRTTTERTPKLREASTSARGSACASSQRCAWRVLMHSAVSPRSRLKRAPNSGAFPPVLARHTISPSRSRMTAAPVAPVARHACSTISLRTTSSARPADSSGDIRPPPCASNVAARSARSNSAAGLTLCRAVPSSAALSAGGKTGLVGSDPNMGSRAIREELATEYLRL